MKKERCQEIYYNIYAIFFPCIWSASHTFSNSTKEKVSFLEMVATRLRAYIHVKLVKVIMIDVTNFLFSPSKPY